jgi:hypothetical protein
MTFIKCPRLTCVISHLGLSFPLACHTPKEPQLAPYMKTLCLQVHRASCLPGYLHFGSWWEGARLGLAPQVLHPPPLQVVSTLNNIHKNMLSPSLCSNSCLHRHYCWKPQVSCQNGNSKFCHSGNLKFLVKQKPQLSTTPTIICNTMQPSTLPKVVVRRICLFPNSVSNVVEVVFVGVMITLCLVAIATIVMLK